MRQGRMLAPMGIAIALFAFTGCVPEPSSAPQQRPAGVDSSASPASTAPTAGAAPAQAATFVSVVDGDTIETSAGTVRIVGIDTPERGQCGHDRASAAVGSMLAPGDAITLQLSSGQNDRDRHGRLIRYVTTPAGADVGLVQLESGNAVARYDSLDGYPSHPREAAYHSAQIASFGADRSVVTLACEAAGGAPATGEKWWENYPSCAQLKRNDVGHPAGPFARDDPAGAEAYEWFANRTGNAGDGDGDGLACE